MPIASDILNTPLGPLRLEATEVGLSAIRLPSEANHPAAGSHSNPILEQAKNELNAYFHSALTRFTVKLDCKGTPFQQAVWQALLKLPYGETVSYRDIALAIARPRSARPVGGAVGRNPLPIIVPCHRVIGSDRSLTGFSGGLWVKEQLLQLEGSLPSH
jgi:methylated-DNA-[protein]-cysteine S-methyltransferase